MAPAQDTGRGAGRLRSRRDLLAEGVLAAGALAATTPLASAARSRTRGLPKRSPAAPRDLVSHGRFGSGVASGVPQLDGAPLWTRVDGIDRRGRIWLEVARSPDFRHVVDRRLVEVRPETDFTVHHLFASDALRPGDALDHRLATRHDSSRAPRLRPTRPPDYR